MPFCNFPQCPKNLARHVFTPNGLRLHREAMHPNARNNNSPSRRRNARNAPLPENAVVKPGPAESAPAAWSKVEHTLSWHTNVDRDDITAIRLSGTAGTAIAGLPTECVIHKVTLEYATGANMPADYVMSLAAIIAGAVPNAVQAVAMARRGAAIVHDPRCFFCAHELSGPPIHATPTSTAVVLIKTEAPAVTADAEPVVRVIVWYTSQANAPVGLPTF